MTDRIPWIKRTFSFDFPVELHREILERLRGTPARIEDHVRKLPPEWLTRHDGHGWSIQENVGHLLDLEPLVMARVDDYEAGRQALHAADMTNKATAEAHHNERPIESILSDFRRARMARVDRLEAMPPDRFARSAIHPRLKQPMRLVDMMFFQAEHDDYHLARIREIIRHFTQADSR